MKKDPVRRIVYTALWTAVLEGSKALLAAVPGVELVSLLLIEYTLAFGPRQTLVISYLFTAVECLIYGIGIWTADYCYVWQILIFFTWLLRKKREPWVFAVLAGLFGLSFGALCAIATVCVGGWSMAFSWWVSGIPFDIAHGIANFLVVLLLHQPLRGLLEKMARN